MTELWNDDLTSSIDFDIDTSMFTQVSPVHGTAEHDSRASRSNADRGRRDLSHPSLSTPVVTRRHLSVNEPLQRPISALRANSQAQALSNQALPTVGYGSVVLKLREALTRTQQDVRLLRTQVHADGNMGRIDALEEQISKVARNMTKLNAMVSSITDWINRLMEKELALSEDFAKDETMASLLGNYNAQQTG